MTDSIDRLLEPGEEVLYRAPPTRWFHRLTWYVAASVAAIGAWMALGMNVNQMFAAAAPVMFGFVALFGQHRVETAITSRRVIQVSGGRDPEVTETPL